MASSYSRRFGTSSVHFPKGAPPPAARTTKPPCPQPSRINTPEGIHQRLSLTRAYLERKTQEYEALHAELASLRAELGEGVSHGQPAGPRQPVNLGLEASHPADITDLQPSPTP